jgi:hypothetical protein
VIFLEQHARWLLVLHGIVAGALVGSATHHALSCRHYLAGRFDRVKLERRYGLVASSLFVATFALGALLYPAYKVRVRAEFLDSPSAVAAEQALRTEAEQLRVRSAGVEKATAGHGLRGAGGEGGEGDEATAGAESPGRTEGGEAALSGIAHVFDIKEHWAALGLGASLLLVFLGFRAHPTDDRRFAPVYFGLSLFVCLTAWIGALVGFVTTSFRSVGGL